MSDQHKIEEVREELDWSASEMGAFLGRSRATIYNWEKGGCQPDKCVRSVVDLLHEDIRRKRHALSLEEYRAWSDQLKEEGVKGYISALTESSREWNESDILSWVHEAESNGEMTVRSRDGTPILYLFPLSQEGVLNSLKLISEALMSLKGNGQETSSSSIPETTFAKNGRAETRRN